jgi:plastocyanin
MRRGIVLLLLAATVAAVVALPVVAATPKVAGTVGPGFTIAIAKKPTKAGKYTLVVSDKSSIHNFHLTGPGVNVKTSVAAVGSKTFRITLKKGKYTFLCDPHASTMHGTFRIR